MPDHHQRKWYSEAESQSHCKDDFFHISQHLNRVFRDFSKVKRWQSRLVQAIQSLIMRNATGVSGINVSYNAPLLARRLIPWQNIWGPFFGQV